MLLGNNQTDKPENNIQTDGDFVVQLISNARYAEAYQLLAKEPARKVSSLFNLALCCCFASQYAQALRHLDEALSILRPATDIHADPENELYKNIVLAQNLNDAYRSGITERYVRCFPAMTKNNIIRLKVDCYLALKQWSKVIETAAPLKARNYRNIAQAVEVAGNNIK